MSTPRREARTSSGISLSTLIIASLSSMVAAIVVHEVWRSGAIIGAAITPLIVGIVSEALRRPVDKLATVRESGRRLPPERAHDVAPVSRDRGDDPFGLWEDARRRRSRGRTWLVLGVVTGVIGFAVAAFVLTGSELIFGGSVGSSPRKTTIFGGGSTTTQTTTTVQTVTRTTTVPTVTQTVPAPAPEQATVPTAPQTVPTTPQDAVPQQQQVPTAPQTVPTTPTP